MSNECRAAARATVLARDYGARLAALLAAGRDCCIWVRIGFLVKSHAIACTLVNMSSCTDLLQLNEKSLFKDIRPSLAATGAKETRNVLEIRDNILYVWNADKCCVQTLNVSATRGKLGENVPYQVSPISVVYDVTCTRCLSRRRFQSAI